MKNRYKCFLTLLAVLSMISSGCAKTTSSQGNKIAGTINSVSQKMSEPTPSQFACNDVPLSTNEKVIWHGKSEGYDLCWTDRDFYVSRSDQIRKYFSSYADDWFREVHDGKPGGIYQLKFRVQSVVGTIVSVEIEETITGEDVAMVNTEYSTITIDITKPFRIAQSYSEDEAAPNSNGSLVSLFSERAIYQALLENDEVSLAVSRLTNPKPRTLEELLKRNMLVRKPNLILEGYAINKFRFDSIENNKVIISVELLDSYNTHQGEPSYIRIRIPIKEAHGDLLRNAFNQRAGFMFESTSSNFRKRFTFIENAR